jgi:choline dehydrogenase-like flavoprotein
VAAGGIETPRLLLLSNRQVSAGVANRTDLVDRYFIEHLTVPSYARFYPANPSLPLVYYRGVDSDRGKTWEILRMSDREMRDHHLPNVRFQLASEINVFNKHVERPGLQSLRTLLGLQTSPEGYDLGRHIANMIADIDQAADAAWYRILHHPNYPLRYVDMVHIGKQTPNPDSRVKISTRRDRYSQPVCVIDWPIQRLDSDGAWRTAQRLKAGLAKARLGRLEVKFDKSVFAKFPPSPHFHHMGTTRMHDDPAKGVVDANCRVHGLGNLFIAVSSVFPTGGNDNPTLTLTALAIRLADHLKKELT